MGQCGGRERWECGGWTGAKGALGDDGGKKYDPPPVKEIDTRLGGADDDEVTIGDFASRNGMIKCQLSIDDFLPTPSKQDGEVKSGFQITPTLALVAVSHGSFLLPKWIWQLNKMKSL